MGSNGIDVSNNNGKVNLAKGFSGLDFVFAKVSEGIGFTDETMPWYHTQARAVGAIFGAYHFGHMEQHAGATEAVHFVAALQKVGGMKACMPLWYDYEAPAAGWQTTPREDAKVITDFIACIKHGFPRAKVGIYSNRDGFGRVLPLLSGGEHRIYSALWLADPTGRTETPDAPLAEWGAWNVHQYETFAGIDRNYSRWDREHMQLAFAWH